MRPCSSTNSSPTRRAAAIRATRFPSTRRSRTSSWRRAPTSSASRPPRPTRSRSSPRGSPTTCSRAPRSASGAPLVLAPAMNNRMYEHPATQRNLELLGGARRAHRRARDAGSLASRGEWGVGRLAEPAEILEALEATLAVGGPLDGLRVLVSAGGTREPIDSVRYVGNRSSGRMGIAVAHEAARRGAEVTLVCANVSLPASGRRAHARRGDRGRARGRAASRVRRSGRARDGGRAGGLPPGERRRRQDREEGPRRSRHRARADHRHPGRAGRRAARRPDARRLRRRARRGRRQSAAATSLRARASTPSS